MTLSVTDVRSNPKDQIAHAADVLGRSKDRLAVFLELHRGKRRIKTASEIAQATGLMRKRVLEEGKRLVHKQIVRQTERDGDIAYERDGFYYAHRSQVIALVNDPQKRKAYPTKYSPKIASQHITISAPRSLVRTASITIDDIDSFVMAHRIKSAKVLPPILETQFKQGFQRIIGEHGQYKDWGGEVSDLYTTRLRLKGARCPAAIAFKGRGTTGVLNPARMGKNGDQIQRLFQEDAEVFIVQYGERIAPSVPQQMAAFAQAKSLTTGKKIYYGVIDGEDSSRLMTAYPKEFKLS